MRHPGTQQVQCFARHAPTRIGKVTQMLAYDLRPLKLGQLDVQRRHCGQTRDPLAFHGSQHVFGQQVVEQHDPRTRMERGGELAEAGVKRQRQGRKQGVLIVVAQIRRHALAASHHVAM